MGEISIKTCSCIKPNSEEKKSEFFPEIERNRNLGNKINTLNTKEYPYSPVTTKENVNIRMTKKKTFSFRQATVDEQFIKSEKIKKIQKAYKGFIFRKKFIKENRKDLLIKESDEYINNKKKEYISENLMEIDTIIKKEFNDNFLDKLQIKENTQKKKYLIKKNSKNEELFLYIGELDLYNGINGYGELYLKNGKKYEGIFINGKLNGYGRLIDSLKMRCYEGNFKDNELLDGKGKIIDIKDDGSKIVYEGDIKNMKKQGKGTEKTKNNNYEGDFSDDLKHGKGKIIFINEGEYYEGDFNQGKMTGNGFIKFKDKSFYDGEFLDGNMHGKGTFTWPDGTMYEGQYANNLREGYGEYRWKNGKIFQGMFKEGKQHGKGVYIKDGQRKEVEYFEGKKIKKGNKNENLVKNSTDNFKSD